MAQKPLHQLRVNRNMRFDELYNLLKEDISRWENRWEHYTHFPYLSYNTKQSHRDPLGIYFFPAQDDSMDTNWKTRKYKFTANIKPEAKILDFAHVSNEELARIAEAAKLQRVYTNIDRLYADLVGKFNRQVGKFNRHNVVRSDAAKFNMFFRMLGYDALFDDGDIIFPTEKQLVVLNPRILTGVKMEETKHLLGTALNEVIDIVKTMYRKYTTDIKSTPIRRDKGVIKSYIEAQLGERQVQIEVSVPAPERQVSARSSKQVNSNIRGEIDIRIVSSSPRLDSRAGAIYDYVQRKMRFSTLDTALAKIFKDDDEQI